jgi:Chitin binding Peritrophin-A domain
MEYGPNTPFYIFCDQDVTTGVRHPTVLRCPNNRHYNGILQECAVPPAPVEPLPPQVDTTNPYNFFCNSADLFPDPLNCTRFYDCPGRARTPVAYACPSPGRYNARTGNCEIGVPCRVIDCAAESTYVVPYDVNSPYYLFCDFAGNQYLPSMYRCPGDAIFNQDTYLCDAVTNPTTTTAAPTTTTPTPATGFTCTSIGSFPDPLNCRVYHICTTANIPSLRHECPTTHFYSISTETCVRQIFIDQCVTINCGGNAARLQLFVPNRRYYADCMTSPIQVFKCPNGKLLDATSGICE